MNLVTQPQLREIIEQITPLVEAAPAPAVRHAPADPASRERWFAEIAGMREKQQARPFEMGLFSDSAPVFEGVEVSEVHIPVDGSCGWSGCPQCSDQSITAIVYRPERAATDVPVYLHFHGGGFWVNGGARLLRAGGAVHAERARALGVVVVDVDYRMAPEHKFPIPVEDCHAALTWVATQAGELGVDPRRIAVGGGSAGANLATAVTLLNRDRRSVPLRGQVLNIPVTDSSITSESLRQFAEGYVMTRQHTIEMWDMYLAVPADAYNPYASPMHAVDLRGLPPALVVLGDYDVLRDEGMAYAGRLIEDGVTVTVRRLPQTHGAALPENGPETERLTDEFLRTNLMPA